MDKSYNFLENEQGIYQQWEESGFFNPDNLNLPPEAKSYSIVLPPPNVTGTLHIGHAGVLTFEDILIRYHRMKGERALWVPGTDHAAIATQTKVEKLLKEEGQTRHSLGREKFLARVKLFAKNSHDTIVGQCKKMGASLDWSREAYTFDETRNKAVNAVFKLMYDDGLIYQGERIVNWCPRCHSTLADDEVEYQENKAKLYYFQYAKDFPIIIATTRPETKLGDTAVAVNPKDKRYQKFIGQEFEIDFIGTKLKLKIIADRNVDMEFGTGALGVTPAHSAVDWQMAENNGLTIIKVIDEDGQIKPGFGEFSGQNVMAARNMVVEKLRDRGLLIKEEEVNNNLSLCYRCQTPIEPLPSRQWFVNVNRPVKRLDNQSIKEICLQAVRQGVFGRKKINIIPEKFQKHYFHWLENLRDWCISRQIWFGHQLPVWEREKQGAKKEVYVGLTAPAGENWRRSTDTLDTWFSSGTWTFSTLARSPQDIKIKNSRLIIDSEDFQKYHPTTVLETAYDILFFWVARMIIMTTYAVHDIPFQDVYLQGLTRDDSGRKMSKSKGNVINPLNMIEKYGADATRLALVIGATPGNDMKLSAEKFAGFKNLVNKLWNIARYAAAIVKIKNGTDLTVEYSQLTLADRWILSELDDLIRNVTNCLDEYRFSETGEALREFTWNIFADWYIEATKFQSGSETEKVLAYVLNNLLKLWHPYIPFVTEKIWAELGNKDLIIAKWPARVQVTHDQSTRDFNLIKNIIIGIRNARAKNMVEPKRKVKALIFSQEQAGLIKKNELLLKGMRTGIGELQVEKSGQKMDKAIYIPFEGIEIYLLGAFDDEKERSRLVDNIKRLENYINLIEHRLADKNYTAKAPGRIVEKDRKKLAELIEEKQSLVGQLKKF